MTNLDKIEKDFDEKYNYNKGECYEFMEFCLDQLTPKEIAAFYRQKITKLLEQQVLDEIYLTNTIINKLKQEILEKLEFLIYTEKQLSDTGERDMFGKGKVYGYNRGIEEAKNIIENLWNQKLTK
jgi:hypothetical protein